MTRLLAVALCLLIALPAAAQDLAASPGAVETALAYVRGQGPSLGLAAPDVADLAVSSAHEGGRSGLTHVYVQQRIGGIDVAEAIVTVAVGRDGRVVHAAGDLVSGTAAAARGQSLTAASALARVAALVGEPVPVQTVRGAPVGVQRLTVLGRVAEQPVAARLVYTRVDGLRLAWEVMLPSRDAQHVWLVRIDAQSGSEISRVDMVTHDVFPRAVSYAPLVTRAAGRSADLSLVMVTPQTTAMAGSYTVYAMPTESPLWATPAPPGDARTAVANPANALASPYGWHDTNGAAGAEYTVTRGNNVYAYTDITNDNVPDAGSSPDGGASLTFNFPLNLANDPSTYRPAAVTNLFYWNNVFHDIAYQHGFTEAAGNFQTNNYGRGGVTFDDAVYAEAQDNSSGSGNCNANFWTPTDSGNDAGSGLGPRPRMQMYTCDDPAGADSDGDLDAGVMVHEYGHGVSNRLTGGSAVVTCLGNTESMGEGWSDWYGLMLTMKATDTRTTTRPIGNYLVGQTTAGAGIRIHPYSTDVAVNPFTYASSRSYTETHDVGEVWAEILWEPTWDMIDAYGFSPNLYDAAGTAGNQVMLHLVTEGMKLQPCSPGYVTGRDAILAADAALYPDPARPGLGLHYTTLWGGFARRGLGYSASQGSANSMSDNVEAFDVPLPAAQVSVASAPISRLAAPGGTAAASVQIGNAGPTGNVVYTSSLENVTFVPNARPPAPAEAVPPVTGGILVAGGKSAGATPTAPTAPTAGRSDAPSGAASDVALRSGQNGGYSFDDSTEPGGPVYAFTSIATTGTAIALGDDASSAALTLPFAFPFYGTNQTSLYVNSNGILSFGAGTTSYSNVGIPTGAAPNNFIAPFWDDLAPNLGGTIHYKTVGSTFVVQFTGVRRYDAGTGSVSFQVILKPSGEITVTYQAVPTTNTSATIGIENATGALGLQAAFNEAYAAPSLAVRFRPGRAWVTASNGSGTVAPGATAQIGLAFDATGLTEGTYTANLVVRTNASSGATTMIPVTLTVGGTGVVSGGAGWRLLAAPATGITVEDLAAINLVQGVPGYYPGVGANLLTGYNGTTWSSAGTGTTLAPGHGFFWYFYNIEGTPGGPSTSHALPTTLATTNPAVTTDTPVTLHASGDKANMLGNPFGVSLRIDNVAMWPGASALSSTIAQTWDAAAGTYETSLTTPTIAAWQGFWVEGATAGTLTIPASARTTGGVLQRADPAPMVAFALAQADGPLQDRAAVVTFPDSATADRDAFDASKLIPMAGAYVLVALGAEGERSVESLPAPTATAVAVPLHVASVGAGSDLVLSWPIVEALPETWTVTLTDMQTGTTVDLRTATEYAFSVQPEAARDPLAAPAARAVPLAASPSRFVLTVGPRGATAGESGPAAVFSLDAPAPNPARGAATLAFSLAEAGAARLSVVDLLGREVAVLVGGTQAAGRHVASVDTAQFAPGVYVVRLTSGRDVASRRLIVVR